MQQQVKAVEKVFEELELEVSSFQKHTRLGCVAGCGACCKKPDIEATILEFIPFAEHLYKTGEAENVLEKLNSKPAETCIIFKAFAEQNAHAGTCTNYKYRGLICRLFGFSARVDKHGKPELSTCRIIKETQAENYVAATEKIAEGLPVPVMRDYYFRLRGIDANLTEKFYPINSAIKQAIEKVLLHYRYRSTE